MLFLFLGWVFKYYIGKMSYKHTHTDTHTHIQKNTHTHIHTHIHTYTHTHRHTQTKRQMDKQKKTDKRTNRTQQIHSNTHRTHTHTRHTHQKHTFTGHKHTQTLTGKQTLTGHTKTHTRHKQTHQTHTHQTHRKHTHTHRTHSNTPDTHTKHTHMDTLNTQWIMFCQPRQFSAIISVSVMPRGLHNTFFFCDKTLLSISGVSSLMDMSVVYTCQLSSCVIRCVEHYLVSVASHGGQDFSALYTKLLFHISSIQAMTCTLLSRRAWQNIVMHMVGLGLQNLVKMCFWFIGSPGFTLGKPWNVQVLPLWNSATWYKECKQVIEKIH